MSPVLAAESFSSMKIDDVVQNLQFVHDQVVRSNGRVEIVGNSPNASAVLISKAELDSLERALDILASTPAAQQMRHEVQRVARLDRSAAGLEPGTAQTEPVANR
jgi:PHD/YefM family antitoxin component YafN of YafNO toxin-antitoxin module